MTYRRMLAASAVVAGAMAALAALALHRLPAGARLPTHWNLAGTADRWSGAPFALFLPVALVPASALLLGIVLPRIEPMQHRLERSATLLTTVWAGLLGMLALVELSIAGPSLGLAFPAKLPLFAIGLLMILVGNALPKSRPGFFVGIRTPWTLLDEDNRIATHRLGAWTTMAGGVLIVAVALLPLAPPLRATMAAVALLGAAVPPVLWSWWLWRAKSSPARGGGPLA